MAFYIIIAIILLCWGLTRCVLMNLHLIYYYGMKDIYMYFTRQKWKDFNYFGIDMFIGIKDGNEGYIYDNIEREFVLFDRNS